MDVKILKRGVCYMVGQEDVTLRSKSALIIGLVIYWIFIIYDFIMVEKPFLSSLNISSTPTIFLLPFFIYFQYELIPPLLKLYHLVKYLVLANKQIEPLTQFLIQCGLGVGFGWSFERMRELINFYYRDCVVYEEGLCLVKPIQFLLIYFINLFGEDWKLWMSQTHWVLYFALFKTSQHFSYPILMRKVSEWEEELEENNGEEEVFSEVEVQNEEVSENNNKENVEVQDEEVNENNEEISNGSTNNDEFEDAEDRMSYDNSTPNFLHKFINMRTSGFFPNDDINDPLEFISNVPQSPFLNDKNESGNDEHFVNEIKSQEMELGLFENELRRYTEHETEKILKQSSEKRTEKNDEKSDDGPPEAKKQKLK